VVATPVFAGTITLTGTLVPGGPQTTETAIITPNVCTGATTAFGVLYRAFPFTVNVSGVYAISEPGIESAVYVYSGNFDPTAVTANCYAASNVNPINFNVSLNAGARYVLVIIEDTFVQDGLQFAVTINGPGTITLEGQNVVPTMSPQGLLLMALILGAAGSVILWRATRVRRT
jgi:hypothetical protein